MTRRPREGVLGARRHLAEVTVTPSSMRLSTTLSPSGRRGRDLRQFRPRPPSVHAPTLPQVMPQFAQQQQARKAKMLSSLSLPLYTPHVSTRMSKLIVTQWGRRSLHYTPQWMVGVTQRLRKHFSLCILPSFVFAYNFFVSCMFILRTRSPAFLVYQ